ncbi:hypothetical protein [Moorena producens]
MGRWGDGEMGRWGDEEMGRWGVKSVLPIAYCLLPLACYRFPILNSTF